MTEVVVIVPVLNRPERVAPLVESLRESIVEIPARPYFVASPDDQAEHVALLDAGVDHTIVSWPRGQGDYAMKINMAVSRSVEPWLFLGADDLRFERGWLDQAVSIATRQKKRVVGTNDLGNPLVIRGRHSTHSLVARSYVEELGTIDQPGVCLHEEYDHQYVDNEFIETAVSRGEFVFSKQSVVEHLHPHWGKGVEDDTYLLAVAEFARDRALFLTRRKRWQRRGRVVVARVAR